MTTFAGDVARAPRRFFLSIGVPAPGTNLNTLEGVEEDLKEMRRLFVDQLGYVDVSFALNASAEALRQALAGWQEHQDLTSDDSVVLYYSGHALKEGDTLFLITRGTDQRRLSTALKAGDVTDAIILSAKKPGKLWLILDCCSAATGLSRELFERGEKHGITIFALAASGSNTKAVDRAFRRAFLEVARAGTWNTSFDGFSNEVDVVLRTKHGGRQHAAPQLKGLGKFDFLGPPSTIPASKVAVPGPLPASAGRRRGRAIGLAVAALLATGWLVRAKRAPTSVAGMIPVDGGAIVMGTDAGRAAAMFAECARIEPAKVCGASFAESPFARQINQSGQSTRVPRFWLDRTEVTNGDFAAWLTARGRAHALTTRPWSFAGLLVADGEQRPLVAVSAADDAPAYAIQCGEDWSCAARPGWAERPAAHVSFYGAEAYCRARGGRLPAQQEWELAARGPEGRIFPWGDAAPAGCQDVSFAGTDAACPQAPAPRAVGSARLDRTPAGVQDLAGNLTEWTSTPFEAISADDRAFCARSPCRVTRGGSFREGALWLRSVIRGRFSEESVFLGLGFRCAKDNP